MKGYEGVWHCRIRSTFGWCLALTSGIVGGCSWYKSSTTSTTLMEDSLPRLIHSRLEGTRTAHGKAKANNGSSCCLCPSSFCNNDGNNGLKKQDPYGVRQQASSFFTSINIDFDTLGTLHSLLGLPCNPLISYNVYIYMCQRRHSLFAPTTPSQH